MWDGNSSYPYLILAHYQRRLPRSRVDDIAVSGATTGTMRLGAQYLAARSFLRVHKGHIALITIDIGGNDILGCVGLGGLDPACSARAQTTIKRNLTLMLAGLHAAAPGVRVIGMTYYNPCLGDWLARGPSRSRALSTLPVLVSLNRELTALYGGAKKTADVQGMFRSTDVATVVASPWGDVPIAVARACSWLDIQCHVGAPQGFGADPNNAGAAAIASAFERTIGRLCNRTRSAAVSRGEPGTRSTTRRPRRAATRIPLCARHASPAQAPGLNFESRTDLRTVISLRVRMRTKVLCRDEPTLIVQGVHRGARRECKR